MNMAIYIITCDRHVRTTLLRRMTCPFSAPVRSTVMCGGGSAAQRHSTYLLILMRKHPLRKSVLRSALMNLTGILIRILGFHFSQFIDIGASVTKEIERNQY